MINLLGLLAKIKCSICSRTRDKVLVPTGNTFTTIFDTGSLWLWLAIHTGARDLCIALQQSVAGAHNTQPITPQYNQNEYTFFISSVIGCLQVFGEKL